MCKSSVFLETDANTQNALAELSTGEMFAKSVMLFLSTSVSWPESDRRTPLRWLIETYWLMPQVARDGCKPFFWSILKNMLLFYYIMYFFYPKVLLKCSVKCNTLYNDVVICLRIVNIVTRKRTSCRTNKTFPGICGGIVYSHSAREDHFIRARIITVAKAMPFAPCV